MISRATWIFAAIAVVAIGLRAFALVRMVEPPHTFHGDPEFYTKITAGILEGRWADDVWIFPPGYPLFSLPFALVLGAGWGIVVASVLAGIVLPLLLLFIARFVSHPERAAAAALIIAVVPEAVYSSARALSEAPTLLLLVGTMVLFEAAERAKRGRKRRLFAVGAGVAGGMCALSRPETLVCIPLLAAFGVVFPSQRPKRRSWESAAIFVGAAIIVMIPYVTALHDRSGIWGLSLKPYFNIKKTLVQAGGATFVERRTRWDEYQREYLIRDGRFDTRRIVEGVDLRSHFLTKEHIPIYITNLKAGIETRSYMENVLAALGVLGLLLTLREGRREKREAALAAISGAPFLVVPIMFPPMERYGLVALPALGWGAASILTTFWKWARARVPRLGVDALAAASCCAIVVLGALRVKRDSRDSRWRYRKLEFEAAMEAGNLERAELFVKEGLELDPKNPAVHTAHGELLAFRGDSAGATAALEESLRLGGDRAPIAWTMAMMGNIEEAERMHAPLRAEPQSSPHFWFTEGFLAASRGDYAHAMECYDVAARLGGSPAAVATLRSLVEQAIAAAESSATGGNRSGP